MPMQIDYYAKSVYGLDKNYAADPTIATALSALTGTKTLLPEHVEALKALGFTLNKVIQPE